MKQFKAARFSRKRATQELEELAALLSDPQRSGLYLRYHLLVAYLLERKKVSVGELLGRDFDPARLEQEIQASDD